MSYGGAGPVLGLKAGDFRPQPFPGTQTGIQDMLDYIGVGGHGHLGPMVATGLSNFTMYGHSTLSAASPIATQLVRSAGATGPFIREKTAGEGNAYGASGIVVRNLSLWGNGSVGDGVDFGNQGGASFTSNAYLAHLLVRDFTSGKAVKLLANTISCQDLWLGSNLVGLFLDSAGGACDFHALRIEDNRDVGLRCNSYGNGFYFTHMETGTPVPTNGLIEFGANGDRNNFWGLDLALQVNSVNLITNLSGASNNCFWGGGVTTNGFTYTNLIYNQVWGNGTGVRDVFPFFIDLANATTGSFYDLSNNQQTKFTSSELSYAVADLVDAATIAVNAAQGNIFRVTLTANRTMGAPTNPSLGQKISFEITQDGTGGRTLAWNAAFKTNWVDTGNTLSKKSTISFWYNGTNWMQVGAQSAYL